MPAAALLVVLSVAVTTAVAVRWSAVVELDARVMPHLDGLTHRHAGWHRFWLDVSDVLHPTVLRVLAALTVVGLAVRRRLDAALGLAVTMIGAAVLSTVIKNAVDRPRPVPMYRLAVAGGASYPSGHALTAAAAACGFLDALVLCGIASRRVIRALASVAVVLVTLVALSRLFLAVHFVSDVVGGLLIGTAWAMVTGLLVRRRGVGPRRAGARRLAFRPHIR